MLSRSMSGLMVAIVAGLSAFVPSIASASEDVESCEIVDVEYSAAASLKVTDTLMGAGDGVYRIGPGHIVLRFDSHGGSNAVRMLSYDMPQHFTVVSNVLFWKTTVATRMESRAIPRRGAVAEGTLVGRQLRWAGPAVGFRSDGTLTCDGTMCGQFGAPAPGMTELHEGPNPIDLRPFDFASDMKTFSMPYALTSESSSPKQRSFLALGGREMRRACVPVGSI
jgi:hypothetical protein